MKIQAEVILNLKRDGATSTLLILDEEIYILLDCGLNANLDFSAYHNKLELLSKVEIILLSHVGSEYVGALPFLLHTRQITGSSNRPIQIYSTTPVMKLGLFNAYNQYLNAQILSNMEESQDNVSIERGFKRFYCSFDKCKQVQFFQKKVARVKQRDIIISPICIGNSLGACAWIIQDNLINVMYMIQYSHNADEHLDGINFKKFLKKRIDVLITEDSLLPQAEQPNEIQQPQQTVPQQQQQPQYNHQLPLLLNNKRSTQELKETLKAAIKKTIESYSVLLIVSNPSERVIEIIILLWQLYNDSKKNQEDSSFPPIDFFHNYKRYLQDLVNDQIKYMRKETADVLVDFNPLSPETNFINFENVLNLPPQQHRGPRIVITTQCCLYFPQMFSFIQNIANNDKNTLLFVGKPNGKQIPKRQQWIRQGYIGGIREEPIVLSDLTKTVLKQFQNEEHSGDQQEQQQQIPQNPEQDGSAELINAIVAEQNEDISDNQTVATTIDTKLDDIDGKGIINMDKDIFNNEDEAQQLFEYKTKDYNRFIRVTLKCKRGEYGEELNELENESLRRLISGRKRKDQPAPRSYQTLEQIVTSVYKMVEDTRYNSNTKFAPFLFNSIMNILEFNIVSLSDDKAAKNILTLLNPKKIFYINQGPGQFQEESLVEQTEIHNESLDILNFKNKIKVSSKMQGIGFVGKITMVYIGGNENKNKVNLSLEQESNSANPERQYYGDYPLEKLLEYLQKSGYTFTVAWGGINYLNKVIIKKENQNFSLEGVRCEEFYEIRKLVYDFLQNS